GIKGSILDNNTQISNGGPVHSDCGGVILNEGYNLIRSTDSTLSADSCTITFLNSTTHLGINSKLASSLEDNGGPTLTVKLLASSPAIDAGDIVHGCRDHYNQYLQRDQRNFLRPVDGSGGG